MLKVSKRQRSRRKQETILLQGVYKVGAKVRSIFLVIATVLVASCASKPVKLPSHWTPKCGNVPNTEAEYCFYKVGDKPTSTLWYWPGLLESSEVLTSSYFDESDFRNLIEGLAPINVVVIGYGKGYYIKPPGTKGSPSFSEVTNKVIPFIEKTFTPTKPYKAMGVSQGSANLITLTTILPDLFERAALVHPFVLPEAMDPFKLSLCKACLLASTNFTEREWKIANPSALMRKAGRIPKTLMFPCETDSFDLYPGALELFNLAKLRGFNMELKHDVSGCKHIGFTTAPLLEFLK